MIQKQSVALKTCTGNYLYLCTLKTMENINSDTKLSTFKTHLRCCALLLLGFLFLWQNFIGFSDSTAQENDLSQASCYILSDDFTDASHNPFNLPLGHESDVPETSKEKESKEKEDIDNKWDKWLFNSVYETYHKYSSIKCLFSSLFSSLQNRSTVPIFVLYHSWKSFLFFY